MAKRANTKKQVGTASKARAKKTSAASTTKKRTTKTSAAKTKRSTTKKPTRAKATKKTTKQADINQVIATLKVKLRGLRGLHALSAAVFAALLAVVYTFMEAVERSVVVGYTATDALRDDVLAPAVHNVLTVDVRHLIAAILAVGLVYSVYIATRGWETYNSRANKGVLVSRWVLAAVLGVLALKLTALLLGVYDLSFIKLLGLILLGASFLAYQANRETGVKRKATLFLTAVVGSAVVFLTLAAFVAFSMLYGTTLPLHMYVAADIFALALLAYAVNQLFSLKKRKGFTQPEIVERNYVVITTTATLLFVVTLVLGSLA